MSWCRIKTWPSAARVAGLGVALVFALGACGYQPLYGERGAVGGTGQASPVRAQMSEVAILPIRDRTGQMLRNALIDRITPRGQAAAGRYELLILLSERRETLAVRRDETATRANLHLNARYRLRDTTSGTIVAAGTSNATTSYNLVQSEFATQRALADAQRRGTVLMADDITLRLAAFFNARSRDPNRE